MHAAVPTSPVGHEGGSERRRVARRDGGEEGDESVLLSIRDGEVGVAVGIRLGLVQAQEVAEEGGEFQVMEVCAEGLVPLPGVPSGS